MAQEGEGEAEGICPVRGKHKQPHPLIPYEEAGETGEELGVALGGAALKILPQGARAWRGGG